MLPGIDNMSNVFHFKPAPEPFIVLCKEMKDLTNSQLKSKMFQKITLKCNQLFQGGIQVKVGRC